MKPIRVGTMVPVYSDPVHEDRIEGMATILAIKGTFLSYSKCKVRFFDEREDKYQERIIKGRE